MSEIKWICRSRYLDLREAMQFSAYIRSLLSAKPRNSRAQSLSNIELDLSNVHFCTLHGTLSLATIVSRVICWGTNVRILPPESEETQNFMSYFGFGDLLRRAQDISAVTIIGDLKSRQLPPFNRRVFQSRPIFQKVHANGFLSPSNIRNWVNQLGDNLRQSELFQRARFARAVGAELGTNIVEHAMLPHTPSEGRECFGAIGMRVIQLDTEAHIGWLYRTYGAELRDFCDAHAVDGIAEICVSDPGEGIFTGLVNAYISAKNRLTGHTTGNASPPTPSEVLQFAFDELGTRKVLPRKWATEAHALSRILGLASAYAGALIAWSDKTCLAYYLNQHRLEATELGLGYQASKIVQVPDTWGFHLQLLVPINTSHKSSMHYRQRPPISVAKEDTTRIDQTKYRNPAVVPINIHFGDVYEDPEALISCAETVSADLASRPRTTPLLLDFTGTSAWHADQVATVIECMMNVIRTRLTVLIGMDSNAIVELSDRFQQSYSKYAAVIEQDEGSISPKSENIPKIFLGGLAEFHRVILAVDLSGQTYWLGTPDSSIEAACDLLLDDSVTLETIVNSLPAYQRRSTSPPSIVDLVHYLRANPEFFEPYSLGPNREDAWRAQTTRLEIEQAFLGRALLEHLQRHLYGTDQVAPALHGGDNNQAFLLPHSRKWVSAYIESSRLFQEEHFAQELGEVMARQIRIALNGDEPSVLICSTAPTVLIAECIRPYLTQNPIFIVDIGHYFDEVHKEALDSLSGTERAVIIQDVFDTGRTIGKVIDKISKNNVQICAIICVIEFSDNKSVSLAFGNSRKQRFGIQKTEMPFISMFRMTRPNTLSQVELLKIGTDKRFWVEPYSLHPFLISSLASPNPRFLPATDDAKLIHNNDPLSLLERVDGLRIGHYVFEDHHFGIVTRMRRLFEDYQLRDAIAKDIADSCPSGIEDTFFLLPLHSHVRGLRHALLDMQAAQGTSASYTFALRVKSIGPRAYYMLPACLERLIQHVHDKVNAKPFNLVIVDDAIASARTLETLLRAVYLADVRAAQGKTGHKTALSSVTVYSVLNRMGRSRTTLFGALSEWRGVPLQFRSFMSYELPVYDVSECPLCRELSEIERILAVLTPTVGHGVRAWLLDKQESLAPTIVTTPKFDALQSHRLPNNCGFRFQNRMGTLTETALLIFLENAERGCPCGELLSVHAAYTKQCGEHMRDPSVHLLRKHIWMWLFSHWDRVMSELSFSELDSLLVEELAYYPWMSNDIVWSAAMAVIAGKAPERILKYVTRKIFRHLSKVLVEHMANPASRAGEDRADLYYATVLLWSIFCAHPDRLATVRDLFIRLVDRLPDQAAHPGDFQGSMRQVMKNMIIVIEKHRMEFIDALRRLTYETLMSGTDRDRTGHANRLATHLRSLPDTYQELLAQGRKHSDLSSSITFLRERGSMLVEAARVVSSVNAGADPLVEPIDGIEKAFTVLADRLEALVAQRREFKEEDEAIWKEVIEQRRYLESALAANSPLVEHARTKTITIADIIEEVRNEAIEQNVSLRLRTSVLTDSKATVFADYWELRNLIRNHTVDFLRDNENALVAVKAELDDSSPGDRVVLRFMSGPGPYEEAAEAILQGHGLRLESWALRHYGCECTGPLPYQLPDDVSSQPYALELRFSLIRGHL